MVDVQVGPLAPPVGEPADEVDEGLALGRAVVGPERAEHGRTGVDLDDAEEVLQAPGARAALGPQRVSLEVEEHVTGAGRRHPAQRLEVGDLGAHASGGVVLLLELEAGLLAQAVERGGPHVGHRLGAHGEVVDRGDPRLEQLAAGGAAHARDEEEVAGRLDLGLADLAPAAGEPQRVTPRGGLVGRAVREEQGVEAGAAGEVDRHDVVEREVAHVTAADDEPGVVGRVDTGLAQQRGVGGDLQEGGHALGARQLGVADQPAVVGALEEVGVARRTRRRRRSAW